MQHHHHDKQGLVPMILTHTPRFNIYGYDYGKGTAYHLVHLRSCCRGTELYTLHPGACEVTDQSHAPSQMLLGDLVILSRVITQHGIVLSL